MPPKSLRAKKIRKQCEENIKEKELLKMREKKINSHCYQNY